ncbi:hypothetical protein BV22DRAFT_918457 [Leucogyrophana mollusca]|uniref:Uncharacterized protein n=1 Tax=Leucogyrophana mollusca TaxID=85980 RepID=A0ACB8AYY7_9AGAM|nr:hypothetical protein BV22DRAFT_918457 [Leucogyrophana mollusca]
METVRILPNSFPELMTVARDWTKPPPDAIFSLRVPIEFASSSTTRLVFGPYVYLTGEDSYQIATHGLQDLWVEIVSDAPPPPDEPPPRVQVRDRARSVTSSILDLPAVPEPVVPHQDGSSHHESEWSRGSSFDSILDLPAVLEPGKRRPRKKQAHRPAVRTPPVAATVAPAELAGGPVDSPRASKAAADEIRAGPSAQSATGAGPSTPRSHQGPLAPPTHTKCNPRHPTVHQPFESPKCGPYPGLCSVLRQSKLSMYPLGEKWSEWL